ncbi:MAG: MBL fold metallo-hydrolase, partial [Planctomycetes bacterium]|nr:MBL fold metallo-hydrolase [Planctomycetota bacterium]
MRRRFLAVSFVCLAVSIGAGAALLRKAPNTAPDEFVTLADGVYFRHGNLDEHSHCNNGVVVFRDFVVVVDANFPSGAARCLEDIEKITEKPVRFVFDTHHHGDHAYGNPFWVSKGAVPVAHENVVGEFERYEPKRWRESEAEREDVKALGLKTAMPPVLTFPDHMVLDDGERRAELLHFGTAHTRGDGFLYLPAEKILFTGDAVVNGPYNYMGDGNTESWLQVLDALTELDIEVVAPGHGACSDASLIARQRAYIQTLRDQVAAGIAAGQSLEAIQAAVKVPQNLKQYVGEFFFDQIEKIHSEMTGLELPYELEQLGFKEEAWTARSPGAPKPKKIVVSSKFFTDRPHHVTGFRSVAPGVEVVLVADPLDDPAPLKREIVDADGLICSITSADAIPLGKNLRWVHSVSAGVDPYVGIGTPRTPGIAALVDSNIVLTNGQRCYGANIADHVFAHLLAFTRKLKTSIEGKLVPKFGKTRWESIEPASLERQELRRMTILIVGVGGIGGQVAERADAFGMRVLGIDPQMELPRQGVDVLRPPSGLRELLPQADVLVLSCPLTKETRSLIGRDELALLPDGAIVINVSR